MSPALRAALMHCCKTNGYLTVRLDGSRDGYVLKLWSRGMKPYQTFRLSWPEWFAVYCLWQEILRPQTGRAYVREAA